MNQETTYKRNHLAYEYIPHACDELCSQIIRDINSHWVSHISSLMPYLNLAYKYVMKECQYELVGYLTDTQKSI